MCKTLRPLLLMGVGLLAGSAWASDLPPGFVEEQIVNGNILPGMVAISIANDGTLFLGRTGPSEGMQIYILRPGATDPTLAYAFPLFPVGEQGVHGIRVDPDHDNNDRLWVYYSVLDALPVHNRLSYFTVALDDTLTNEVVVLDLPPLSATVHNGGCLVFDSAGRIFLGTGDDTGNNITSQDPFDLRGKILHLNQDGSPASDNMSLDGSTAHPLVWATGVRNPYRCSMQPGLDNLFFADVGWFTWEELDLGIPGANYGWANIEGPEPVGQPGYTYPIHSYNHNGGGAAIIGGDHAEAIDFADPNARDHDNPYEGDYFFVEWTLKELWRLKLDQSNNVIEAELFASNLDGLINDMEFGPDGSLYLVGYSTSSVSKITYVGGVNRQPDAQATVTPSSGLAPLAVTLDGTASSDPDGDSLTHFWDLGDGTFSGQPLALKSYPVGVYEAELTVYDTSAVSDTTGKLKIVSGNEAPTASILSPTMGTMYDAGQMLAYSGSATDPEDGAIPCSQVTWQVTFHHANHTHPFIGPIAGNCGDTITIPDIGEESTDVWYEFRFVAQDSGAPIGAGAEVSGEGTVVITPNLTSMEIQTSPNTNLEVTWDSIPFTAPAPKNSVVGFLRSIGTPEFQLAPDGHTYRWLSWDHGGTRDQTFPAPAIPAVFTANYGCEVLQPITLMVARETAGQRRARLQWTSASGDPCIPAFPIQYEIWGSTTYVPMQSPGSFPADPPFTLVDTTTQTSYIVDAASTVEFFLVGASGTDLLPAAVGHYGR